MNIAEDIFIEILSYLHDYIDIRNLKNTCKNYYYKDYNIRLTDKKHLKHIEDIYPLYNITELNYTTTFILFYMYPIIKRIVKKEFLDKVNTITLKDSYCPISYEKTLLGLESFSNLITINLLDFDNDEKEFFANQNYYSDKFSFLNKIEDYYKVVLIN